MIIDRLLAPSFNLVGTSPEPFDLDSTSKWQGSLIAWVPEYQYDNFEIEPAAPTTDLYFLIDSVTPSLPLQSFEFFIGAYIPLLDEDRKIQDFTVGQEGQFDSTVTGTVSYQAEKNDTATATRVSVSISIDSLSIDFESLPTYDNALTVGTFQFRLFWTLDDASVVETSEISLNILLYREVITPTPTPTPTYIGGTPWELTVCQGFTKKGEVTNSAGVWSFGTNGYCGVVVLTENDINYGYAATNTLSLENAFTDPDVSDWIVFLDSDGYNVIACWNTYSRIQGTTYTRLDEKTDKSKFDSEGVRIGGIDSNFFNHTAPVGSPAVRSELPEISDLFGLTYSFFVNGINILLDIDWGDGTSRELVRTSGLVTHTYPSVGIYTIKLYCGLSTAISFNFGDCLAGKPENYHKLIAVGDTPYIPGMTSCTGIFSSCTGLSSITPNLFKNNPQILYLDEGFYNCSGITSTIPTDLLKYNSNLASVYGLFWQCTSLSGTIPTGFLSGKSNLREVSFLFANCFNLTGTIPSDLFFNCSSISNCSYAFLNCQNLTGEIPADLFKYSPAIHSFLGTFSNCYRLTSIPPGLFDFNVLVGIEDSGYDIYNFETTFDRCYSITSQIPSDLFKYNTLVKKNAFKLTFYGCQSITGDIPTDLFRYNTLASTEAFSSTFQFCGALTGSIPTDLFRYNTLVSKNAFYQTFTYCYNLSGSIPEDLFRYNTLTISSDEVYSTSNGAFRATFHSCRNLTGAIPTDLFKYTTLVQSNGFELTFFGCKKLSSTIPIDLFRYTTQVSDYAFNSTFEFCESLTGAIPTDLFRYNTLVRDQGFYQTFAGCSLLSSIPKNLFLYNTVTNSFYATLQGCNNLTLDQELFCTSAHKSTIFKDRSIDFRYCMNYGPFTGVIGTAPDLWSYDFGTGIVQKSNCFKGQTYLSVTNINDIPLEWGRNPP